MWNNGPRGPGCSCSIFSSIWSYEGNSYRSICKNWGKITVKVKVKFDFKSNSPIGHGDKMIVRYFWSVERKIIVCICDNWDLITEGKLEV